MFCYIVCADHPEYVLTVKGDNHKEQREEGQKLEIHKFRGTRNQQFAIFDREIAAVVTGQKKGKRDPEHPAMILEPEELEEKKNIVLKSSKRNSDDEKATQWFFNVDQTISTADGKFVFDVEGAKFEDGTDVIIYPPNGNSNQKWIPVTVYDGEPEEHDKTSSSSSSSSSSDDEHKEEKHDEEHHDE